MNRRTDKDRNAYVWDAGTIGTILHTWGDETSDVVPVVLLGRPINGQVAVRAEPHDGGDFYLVLDTQQIVPISPKITL